MVMRPEIPLETQLEQTAAKKIERYEHKLLRKTERRTGLSLKLTAGLALANIALAGYWADVHHNVQVEAAASISVNYLYPTVEAPTDFLTQDKVVANLNSALYLSTESKIAAKQQELMAAKNANIFLDGFNTYDADIITKYYGPGMQQFVDSEQYSVSYGNATLEPSVIADKTTEVTKKRGAKVLSITGHSAGGVAGIETAEKLLEDGADINLITTISMPDGEAGVQQRQKYEMAAATTVAQIPGATHSKFVRTIGELYFRRDRIFNKPIADWPVALYNTTKSVLHDMDNKETTGMWLLTDQVLMLSDARLKERIAHIAELTKDGRKPVFVYIGTDGRDYMVDDKLSSKNTCDYAIAAGFQCFKYFVPNFEHTRPDLATNEFNATLKAAAPEVRNALEQELNAFVLRSITVTDERIEAQPAPAPVSLSEITK